MNVCLVPDCMSMAAAANNVCDACWDHRLALRRAIPGLWFGLHSVLEPGSHGFHDMPGASPPIKSRPPLQVGVLDALQAVPAALAFWANGLLAQAGAPLLDAAGVRWGVLLSRALAVLDDRDHVMRLDYQARLYVTELVTLNRRMLWLSTLDPTVSRLNAPCPACGNPRAVLLRDTTTGRVVCPACRGAWEHEAFIAMVVAKAGKG